MIDVFSTRELPAIHNDCWKLLEHAVSSRDCGWRLPALATSTPTGVRQRAIVLRAVHRTSRRLFFHTDLRSPKVEQIQSIPRASLHFYDHALSVQVQIQGTTQIHVDDETAESFWQQGPAESLRSYMAPLAPGTPSDQPSYNLPDDLRRRIPEKHEIAPGRRNFGVLSLRVEELEWLLLSRQGNLRTRFLYSTHPETQNRSDQGNPADSGFPLPETSDWLAP